MLLSHPRKEAGQALGCHCRRLATSPPRLAAAAAGDPAARERAPQEWKQETLQTLRWETAQFLHCHSRRAHLSADGRCLEPQRRLLMQGRPNLDAVQRAPLGPPGKPQYHSNLHGGITRQIQHSKCKHPYVRSERKHEIPQPWTLMGHTYLQWSKPPSNAPPCLKLIGGQDLQQPQQSRPRDCTERPAQRAPVHARGRRPSPAKKAPSTLLRGEHPLDATAVGQCRCGSCTCPTGCTAM